MKSDQAPTTSRVLIPPPLAYIASLLVAWLLNRRWPISVGSPPGAYVVEGILLFVALGIFVAALRQFVRAKTPISVRRPTTALITSGPYQYSRNPLYVGLTFAYLGFAVAFKAIIWALVLLPFLLLVIQTQVITREERYLEQRFEQAYRDYKARVRRWL